MSSLCIFFNATAKYLLPVCQRQYKIQPANYVHTSMTSPSYVTIYLIAAYKSTLCSLYHRRSSLTGEVFTAITYFIGGPGSIVTIATGYGLDSPGMEFRYGDIFRTCPDRPWGPPSLLYNGYRFFPGAKKGPGRDADPSLTSSAVVKKG